MEHTAILSAGHGRYCFSLFIWLFICPCSLSDGRPSPLPLLAHSAVRKLADPHSAFHAHDLPIALDAFHRAYALIPAAASHYTGCRLAHRSARAAFFLFAAGQRKHMAAASGIDVPLTHDAALCILRLAAGPPAAIGAVWHLPVHGLSVGRRLSSVFDPCASPAKTGILVRRV